MNVTTSDRATRACDLRVLAATAAIVIVAGSLIAFGMTKVGGNSASECGEQALGLADAIRDDADLALIPQYRSFGGGCDLWLAVVDGEVIAVRRDQRALDCQVDFDGIDEKFRCEDRVIPITDLETWPLEEKDVAGEEGVLVIDFSNRDR